MANEKPIVVMGAGPAGLTAAWLLTNSNQKVVVWEADPKYVGGIARTVEEKGYRFDIGGHRFFSKSEEINEVWHKMMPDDFIECPRLSRIFYNKKFFNYPLEPWDAFFKLGPIETFRVIASYYHAQNNPIDPEVSFEDWVTNRFGERLFAMFFKSYTEKVWGMSTSDISKDWAAQRIKGLNLKEAIYNAFFGRFTKSTAKTLIKQFLYPRLGPGQLWERATFHIRAKGNQVTLDRNIINLHWEDGYISHITAQDSNGSMHQVEGSGFISSIPLRDLIHKMDPEPPKPVVAAANRLRYRDFLSVILAVNKRDVFPDTWIYIHDPTVKVGRIQNYKNWSISMVPNPKVTSLGLEYFCFEGDALWASTDKELRRLAIKEAIQIGLIQEKDVLDAFVVRMPKAYPIYDRDYKENVKIIAKFLNSIPNIQPVGRNGMHHYNNQDHSMMTALLAARNILGEGPFDPWNVNTDAEYHEIANPAHPETVAERPCPYCKGPLLPHSRNCPHCGAVIE